MSTAIAEHVQTLGPSEEPTSPVVHCIVHPGFDAGEHPDFEAHLHGYIEYIASTVGDVIFFVSDGELFDEEQVRQFELIRMIEGISMFLSLHDGGIGDLLQSLSKECEDSEEVYFQTLENNGLSRTLYKWCQANIDLTELDEVAEGWRAHKKVHFSSEMQGKEKWEWLEKEAARLRELEKEAKMKLDISTLTKKAFDELGVVEGEHSKTHRNVKNRPRFIRLYQHALQALGRERVREIFIADEERSEAVAIEPVTHFRNEDRTLFTTPVAGIFPEKVFHASEEATYGNASELLDGLTYRLSLSRHQKLLRDQPLEVLRAMNFPLTPETKFIFSGEYRERCVSNVAKIVHDRLETIGGQYFLADDRFTLLCSDDTEETL